MRRWPGLIVVLLVALAASAQERAALPATAKQDFRVSGTVVDAVGGGPVAHAKVVLAPALNPSAERAVLADDSGHFAFEDVKPAKYVLTAKSRGFPAQAFDEHENFSSAIVVGPELVSEGLVFRLRPGAEISGTVTDEFSEAVRSGQVILFRDAVRDGKRSVHMVRQAGLNDLGTFRFGGLPAGKYFIALDAQPWYGQGGIRAVSGPGLSSSRSDRSLDVAYPLTFYANATDPAGATAILLKPGEQAIADLTLRAVPAVHLKIRTAKEGPRSVASLMQRVFDGYELNIPSHGWGKEDYFEIGGVAPGHYLVRLNSFNPNNPIAASALREIDLFSDTEIDAQEAQRSLTVSGKVAVEGAAPLPPSALIVLRDQTFGRAFPVPVSPNGEFEMQQNLLPGTYEVLFANAPGFLPTSIAAVGARVTGRSVQMRDGATVRLTVTVSRGLGRVDGIATQDGRPIAGAMIVLVPQSLAGDLTLVRRDQSDSDGTFTLPEVVPGTYTVVAIKHGWDLEWANPSVLKPYIALGHTVRVEPSGKYYVNVESR